MSKPNLEQTLIVFKPDALQRGLVGEILTRFERVGLRIVGTKMLAPDAEHYYKHYEEIGKLKSLKILALNDIELTQFPKFICNLENLWYLLLGNNKV